MNFKKILDYQKKDFELFTLERTLANSNEKNAMEEARMKGKELQSQIVKLEKKAKEVMQKYAELEEAISKNIAGFEKCTSKNLETSTEEEIEELINFNNDFARNFNILDKKARQQAQLMGRIINNREASQKIYPKYVAEYKKKKEIYEELEKKSKPNIDKIKKELAQLEKNIDKVLIEKYKVKRQDNINLPIIAELINDSCSGCNMLLSQLHLDKLKSQGYVECENCHRIIYIDDNKL